jgi:chromosome segregation protein
LNLLGYLVYDIIIICEKLTRLLSKNFLIEREGVWGVVLKLKKIEILGFKSFADKTALTFHPGITAVVGPNGCGKSNISDSFRWVLGEQSAKSMRGSKMHDVIFAGTTTRKPLNFAEVTITLSDVEGNLPTEFEEVSVTRRLHRNGESEYLLNRRPVRLKDVYDLFLDSGIGKNAFSIFEQGKIDQVINLSSLERRYIFEEAAGILRFLQRKREALKRLEQTEQNIERVRDIHKEVERQIIVLEQQAEKAKVYKENKTELEKLEIGLFTVKWDNLERRRESAKEKEEAKRIELTEGVRELDKSDLERQNSNIQLIQAQKELQTQREKVFITRSDKEIKAKEWQSGEERLREMMGKEKQWRRELDEMVAKRQQRQLEAEQTLIQQEKVEAELHGLEGIRKEQQEKVHLLEEGLGGLRDRQHETQKELLQLLQKENQIESELKQATLRLEHTQDRKKRVQEHQETLIRHLEEFKRTIENKKVEVEASSEDVLMKKEQYETFEQQIEDRTIQIKETQDNLDAIYQEKAELKARQNVLLRLRDEMEGFSSGTKKLLNESANPGSPLYNRLKGLYESLSPNEGSAMALSVVMRPYIQTLVVQSQDDFQTVVAFAKEKNIRDFSLICLDQIPPSAVLTPSIESAESLLSRVQDNLLAKHFLNRKYVVKNREEALGLIQCTPGVEVWAEDGIFVDSNGVIFFTSEGEKNVFLREAELKSLVKKLEDLETRRSTQEVRLKEYIQLRSQIQAQKNELDQMIRKSEMKLVELKYALQRLVTDHEKGEKDIAKDHAEIAALDQASAQLRQQVSDLNQKHAEANFKAEEIQALVDSLSEQLDYRVDALKVEQNDLQAKNTAFQKVSEEKRKIIHMLNVFEVKDLESLQQEKRLEEEMKSIRDKQSQLQLNLVGYEQQLEELERVLSEVLEGCKEFEQAVTNSRHEISQIEEAISARRNALKHKENELYEIGIQAAQLDSSRQSLETELQERFHLTIQDARGKEIHLDRTIEKAERDIRSLRRQIEDAGDVNMTSIEEFDKYKERYEFLNQQIDDLTMSKNELIEIITQLDTESRKIFKETFEIIRENFKKNFQILFRGGESDLQFTEAADILEAGIEIVAKPPGKQMRSINLLSGGEKCLTAIALLFAIFEVKPAPFCILDEIDAPLDDTNVERFVNVVKQFTDKCQFIIITHNKRTMSIADMLYGVSMQEKGVSKILSLEFSKEIEPEPSLV